MRALKLILASFSFSLLLTSPSWASAPLCSSIFLSPDPAVLLHEDKQAIKMHDYLSEKILRQSSKIESQLSTESSYSPVVVIGNGLHGSLFNNRAGLLGQSRSVLAIDAGNQVSKVFGDLGGSFLINSRETSTESTNIFPGSPVVMKDFTSAMFPNSIHMGLLATVTQRTSSVPLLLGHKVTSIVDTSIEGQAAQGRYRLTTEKGLIVYTDKVVLATGLGSPSSKVRDPGFQKLLAEGERLHTEAPEKIYPVMLVDTFLRTVTLKETGKIKTIQTDLKNKTVAVIGVGDGAKIGIEALLTKFDPSLKILWLGQKATSPESYKETTWFRYHGLAPEIGKRILGGFEGHVTAGKEMPSGQIELTYGEQNKTVLADYVINCTGYDNAVPPLLQNISGKPQKTKITLQDVEFAVPEIAASETIIGKKVEVEGLPAQDIFVIGPAAGALASPKELNSSITQNPVAIENLAYRSRAMADYLFGNQKPSAAILKAGNTLRTRRYPVHNEPLLLLDKSSLHSLLKTEAHRVLRELQLPPKGLLLKAKIHQNQLEVSVLGLSAESATRALKKIEEDKDLLSIITQNARIASEVSLAIRH